MRKIAYLFDEEIRYNGRTRRLIESLSQRHKIYLFCPNQMYAAADTFFNANVELIYHQPNNTWIKRNLFFNKSYKDLYHAVLNTEIVFDAIICNNYPLLDISVKIKEALGSVLIYDNREIYIETLNQFFPNKGWKRIYGAVLTRINKLYHARIEKKCLHSVDRMITVCDSLSSYFKALYAFDRILVVRNCPKQVNSIADNDLLRKLLHLPSDQKILLHQGNINISRGIEKIALSMPYINPNVHFVVMGDGPKLNAFKKDFASDRIHFIGNIPFDELYAYTASADIGISTIEPYNLSKIYSLPNKVFEYMIATIPFITNQLFEVSKIVREENCGFIIDDSSPEMIASGINAAFMSDKLKTLGQNGYNAIVKKYNWEMEVSKLLDYIDKI